MRDWQTIAEISCIYQQSYEVSSGAAPVLHRANLNCGRVKHFVKFHKFVIDQRSLVIW